ncbi:hypothetical protein C8R43DRAFT_948294 [Mycena crocata]|nr:hypothetical protein C8R43DRAFT_948294 [Mycena crocata]
MPPGRKPLPPEQKALRRRETLARYAEKHREALANADPATIQAHKVNGRRASQKYRAEYAGLPPVRHTQCAAGVLTASAHIAARAAARGHASPQKEPGHPALKPSKKTAPLLPRHRAAPTTAAKTPKPKSNSATQHSIGAELPKAGPHQRKSAADTPCPPRRLSSINEDEDDNEDGDSGDDYRSAPLPALFARADHLTPSLPEFGWTDTTIFIWRTGNNYQQPEKAEYFFTAVLLSSYNLTMSSPEVLQYFSSPPPGPLQCSPTYYPSVGHENKAAHTRFWAITAGAGDFVGILSSQAAFDKILAEHPKLLSFYTESWLEMADVWATNCNEYHNHEGESLPPPPLPSATQRRRRKSSMHFLPHDLASTGDRPLPEALPEDSGLPLVWISDDEEDSPPRPTYNRADLEGCEHIDAVVDARLRELDILFSRTDIAAFRDYSQGLRD